MFDIFNFIFQIVDFDFTITVTNHWKISTDMITKYEIIENDEPQRALFIIYYCMQPSEYRLLIFWRDFEVKKGCLGRKWGFRGKLMSSRDYQEEKGRLCLKWSFWVKN